MKVKAVDIAKKLNISKATVSLALNNKPGVSEQTRREILQCIAEMEEQGETQNRKNKQIIKAIYIKRELYRYEEMALREETLEHLDFAVRKMGYTLGIVYADIEKGELEQAIQDANEENVAGVICYATEMLPEELEMLKKIHKPVVVHDNDAGNDYNCSVIGNMEAVRTAVDMLVARGCHDIKYLGNSVDIYNFRERRAGYRAGLRKNRLELREDSIVLMGKTTEEVYRNMVVWLQKNRLPDAFVMDNYQVSIGVMRALREHHISVPQDISLIGVDEIPSFVMSDYRLVTIKVQHKERAQALLMLLDQELNGRLFSKFKLVSHCEFLPGNSIR